MEITINIKLEDGDIAILTKAIWELIRRLQSEDQDREESTPLYPATFDPSAWSGTATKNDFRNDLTGDGSIRDGGYYYCNDGESVREKKEKNQKKNEEN